MSPRADDDDDWGDHGQEKAHGNCTTSITRFVFFEGYGRCSSTAVYLPIYPSTAVPMFFFGLHLAPHSVTWCFTDGLSRPI